MAANESNRTREVKVGGDNDHERSILQHRIDGFTKRSATGRPDRFARSRRTPASLPHGTWLRSIASGSHGRCGPGRNVRLLHARAAKRAGEPGAGYVNGDM